ncbi:MAG: hypothetical protein ACYTFW_17485 [Planctomycetota bacterium]
MVVGLGITFASKLNPDGSWKGNECPNGAHYTLNIIGMDRPKGKAPPADLSDGQNNGRRIFVHLNDKTKIFLQEGDFDVIDYDGTDGSARFQLPNPDPEVGVPGEPGYSPANDGITEYSVYMRLMGPPGGKIKMYTAATDPDIGEVTSDLQIVRVCTTGPRKFENVSEELLYIYAWYLEVKGQTATWVYDRIPLFDDRLEDYLWYYENQGVRIAQLRFYEGLPTVVRDPEEVPHLLSIRPYEGTQGDTGITITLTGINTDFDNLDNPAVDVDLGDDIAVSNFTVVDDDTITFDIDLDLVLDDDLGWRPVVLYFFDGSHMSIWFEVLDDGA